MTQTTDQSVRDAALEEAAKYSDQQGNKYRGADPGNIRDAYLRLAVQIRALKSQPAPSPWRAEAFLLGARIMRENLAALMEIKRFLRRGEMLDGFNNDIAETIRDTPLPPPPAGEK